MIGPDGEGRLSTLARFERAREAVEVAEKTGDDALMEQAIHDLGAMVWNCSHRISAALRHVHRTAPRLGED